MNKVQLKDVDAYEAPGHFGMVALKLHGKEKGGPENFWMGMSHFLPGGGAEWAYEDSPTEKIYFVIEGEVKIKTKSETYVLKKNDSIYIAPYEGRELINDSNEPATMLVAITYPEE